MTQSMNRGGFPDAGFFFCSAKYRLNACDTILFLRLTLEEPMFGPILAIVFPEQLQVIHLPGLFQYLLIIKLDSVDELILINGLIFVNNRKLPAAGILGIKVMPSKIKVLTLRILPNLSKAKTPFSRGFRKMQT